MYWNSLLKNHNIIYTKEDTDNLIFSTLLRQPKSIIRIPQNPTRKNPIIMRGGGRDVHFVKTKDDDRIMYSLRELNKENGDDCILVIIDKSTDNNEIAIQQISNTGKCVDDNGNILNGTNLLNISISLAKELKRKNKHLTRIILKDNSYKYCKNSNSIMLSSMSILLTGHTWYGKHGFTPYSSNKRRTEELKKNYAENIKINKSLKVKHVNLIKYIERFYKTKNGLENKYKDIISDIKQNKDTNLGIYLTTFLKDYKRNCTIFASLYKDLFDDAKYHDFHEVSFIMDI